MTKKDFFRILIKLLGFIFLLQAIPMLISQISMSIAISNDFIFFWTILLATLIVIALSCLLIFKPDLLLNLFKFDKGFDDDQIKLDLLKSEKLISVSVLIVGGLFIVNSFAPLLVEIGYKIHASIESNESLLPMWGANDNTQLYTNIIELVMGLYLIFNHQRITHFLAKKNNKNKDTEF